MFIILRAAAVSTAFLIASSAAVTAEYIYPSQGQSAEQQRKDDYECHQWAVSQTGVDPTREQASGHTGRRSTRRGALGGAVVGGVIGAQDGNWGKGAAIGAGAGGLIGGARDSRRSREQHAAGEARLAEYNRAKVACMTGRGYTVR